MRSTECISAIDAASRPEVPRDDATRLMIRGHFLKRTTPTRTNGWAVGEPFETIAVKRADASEGRVTGLSLDRQVAHLFACIMRLV